MAQTEVQQAQDIYSTGSQEQKNKTCRWACPQKSLPAQTT